MTSQALTEYLGTNKISTVWELSYANKGLGWLLPLPEGKKFPVPKGFTGEEGRDPTPEDYARWDSEYKNPGFALRLSERVLVLNVDQHEKDGVAVDGAANFQAWEKEHNCKIPRKYIMTRGNPNREGHLFLSYSGGVTKGQLCPSVDVLRHGHRYSVCDPTEIDGRRYK